MTHRALDELRREQAELSRPYLEFLRSDALSVGLYVLRAGEVDRQRPHREDEVYIVMRGHSRLTAGSDDRDANPGDVIVVPAGVPHRFHEINDDLELIVVFAPPETTPADLPPG